LVGLTRTALRRASHIVRSAMVSFVSICTADAAEVLHARRVMSRDVSARAARGHDCTELRKTATGLHRSRPRAEYVMQRFDAAMP